MIPGKTYTPEDYLAMAWRWKWIILVPFVLVTPLVAAWTYSLPDMFRSETLILVVPQRVPESYVQSTVTARIEDRLQSITQQILSRTRLERIIENFDLYPGQREVQVMEDVVVSMRNAIDVQLIKGDAFRVSFEYGEPQNAMKVTERLASLFIEENLRDREVLAEGTHQFLESQLEDSRRRLVEQEKTLEDYTRTYSNELPSQLEANLQVIQNPRSRFRESAARSSATVIADSSSSGRSPTRPRRNSARHKYPPAATPATTACRPGEPPCSAWSRRATHSMPWS